MFSPPRARRLLVAPVLGGLAAVVLPVALTSSTPVAEASSTYLCTGYTSCAAAGYSSSGYASNNARMYWRMYAGHNCTNYVAYRMVESGMSSERPWSGSGMARDWGTYNADLTDQTPAVGAVAWFRRGLSGGVDGHVAYVEKVISATQIVISEDMWAGDFHWAILTKDGGTWPSGFIHFVDRSRPAPTPTPTPSPTPTKTITPTKAPAVSGTAQVGQKLTVLRGAWNPGGGAFSYQWLSGGTPISGATSGSFVPTSDQLGRALSVAVSVEKSGYAPGTTTTPATAAVEPGLLTSSVPPTVSGEPQVGDVLTATHGAFAPTPDKAVFNWKANGKVIKGATGSRLTLTDALVDKTISVVESAVKDGFAKTVTPSAALGPVVAGVIDVATPFTGSGVSKYGTDLAIAPGTVTPSDAQVAYSWARDGAVVPGATSPTYQLGADDLGGQLVGTVTITKPHYATVTRTVEFAGPVTTHPTMKLTANPKKRAVAVAVRVLAPGVTSPDGVVTIAIGKHRATSKIVDGFVRLLVPDLSPGMRRIEVEYGGTDVIEQAKAATKVKVLR